MLTMRTHGILETVKKQNVVQIIGGVEYMTVQTLRANVINAAFQVVN